ncbi:2-dehydropantoate 2-reductase [Planktotalea sp.]|uniref:2-dehydropantoate 2-reductase n=1 Tax=Planktotalea sp. TaxID=2029877 RepID=UPI00329882F8
MSYHIVILGAGAIGCHFGASIANGVANAGGQVTLIGRDATLDPLRQNPLIVDGQTKIEVPPEKVTLTSDPKALAQADLIALALKSHGLETAMEQIEACAKPATPILSLLNGLAPVKTLRSNLKTRAVIAGMVPFNVVWTSETSLHPSGPGQISVEQHEVTTWLQSIGTDLQIVDDLSPIQHGKLLLNLVNPINALAGVPLYDMLSDRGYRRVYSAAISEALKVYDAAGIEWAQIGPTNPRLALRMLRAPNWVFRNLVLKKQNLDRTSMTSMASDLANCKPTEIDTINGEIVRLGAEHGIETPVNARLVALVKAAEGGNLSPLRSEILKREVGL